MAILKMNEHKRIGVHPPQRESNDGDINMKIGHYNENGKFCLTYDDLIFV